LSAPTCFENVRFLLRTSVKSDERADLWSSRTGLYSKSYSKVSVYPLP